MISICEEDEIWMSLKIDQGSRIKKRDYWRKHLWMWSQFWVGWNMNEPENGSQWISTDLNGSQWISMDLNGSQRISMDLNGSQERGLLEKTPVDVWYQFVSRMKYEWASKWIKDQGSQIKDQGSRIEKGDYWRKHLWMWSQFVSRMKYEWAWKWMHFHAG